MIYFISFIYLAIIMMTLFLSVKIFLGAKDSVLYRLVSVVGIFGITPLLMLLISNFIDILSLAIIANIALCFFAFFTYSLWETTYNQINRNQYTFLIMVLTTLSIVIELLYYFNYLNVMFIDVIVTYQLLPMIIILVSALKFKQFSNQNKTSELNLVPYVLILNGLSIVAVKLSDKPLSELFFMINGLSVLLLLYLYSLDYKNSFYY